MLLSTFVAITITTKWLMYFHTKTVQQEAVGTSMDNAAPALNHWPLEKRGLLFFSLFLSLLFFFFSFLFWRRSHTIQLALNSLIRDQG